MATDVVEEAQQEVLSDEALDLSSEPTLSAGDDFLIEQWISEGHFLNSGVTIEDLASFLGTNRTYLSTYFNVEMGMTFRQWINYLRIEEAKRKIAANPKITMVELAFCLGYGDTSTFFRQFKANEGVQPSVWRQKHVAES